MRTLMRLFLVLALAAVAALAQNVISARSGIVHYVEGNVYIGEQQVESKFGNFPEIKENAVLRTTTQGRAEVLLTPGVFLRVGEASSFRMLAKSLTDTRIEVVSGSAVVEATELPKDNSVTLVYQDYTIHLEKAGLYRLDSEPAALHVFSGKAGVTLGDSTLDVGEGRMLAFTQPLTVAKFDKDSFDALDRWSRRRDAVVSMANVASARAAGRSSLLFGTSGWTYNPFFGMYTFLPWGSSYMSPYGNYYWNPAMARYAYWGDYPRWGAGGFTGGGYTSGGTSTVRPGGGGSVVSSSRMSARPSRTSSAGDFGGIRSGARSQPVGGFGGGGGGGVSSAGSSAGSPAPSSGGVRGGSSGPMGGKQR